MSTAPPDPSPARGRVIVLNGPSVAGKSSIQRALQERFLEPHLAMGIDSMLVGMMPARYFTGAAADRHEVLWGEASSDGSGAPLFTLRMGPKGRRLVSGMHHAVAAFAERGSSVIVDYILYEPEWLDELSERLRPLVAYFVGVRIPLEILEARERQRGTSPAGHARSHYHQVHAHGIYDLEVDSSTASAEACAATIADYVDSHPHPRAFELLRARAAR